jgi:hypothetical protein
MLLNLNVSIAKVDWECCDYFAHKVVDTNKSYYAQRAQTDINAIIYQIIVGKMGECAVAQWATSTNRVCSKVDFSITKDHKSFAPDLIISGKNVHVKSQDVISAERFGLSWSFQYGEGKAGHCDKEIFLEYGKDDSVVFCKVNVDKLEVNILAVLRVGLLHSKQLFKEPKKESLKGIKKVVYYDSIKNLSKV